VNLEETAMKRAFIFFEGVVLGALVGVSLALLLTPASGEELIDRMQSEADRISGEVRHAALERRSELEQQLAALRSTRKPGEPTPL
jgi:gas vesicle protein